MSPMDKINIQFTLFSAFYSPLIAAISAGFLKQEGLDGQWSVAPTGTSALSSLEDGSAHLVQSALSQGVTSAAKGESEPVTVASNISGSTEIAGARRTARLIAIRTVICRNQPMKASGVRSCSIFNIA